MGVCRGPGPADEATKQDRGGDERGRALIVFVCREQEEWRERESRVEGEADKRRRREGIREKRE